MISIYKISAVQGTTERTCTIDKFHLSHTIETKFSEKLEFLPLTN